MKQPSQSIRPTHTILRVRDIDAQRAFYSNVLGLEPIISKDRWVEFELAGLRFCLEKSGQIHQTSALMLALQVDDLDAKLRELKQLGIEPSSPAREINEDDGTKVRWFVFEDIEGSLIGIYGV